MEESLADDVFESETRNHREETHALLYNADMRQLVTAIISIVVVLGTAAAQTPQPFPRPATPQSPAPPPPSTARPTQPPPAPATPPAATAPVDPATPSEATLGFPIYPGAQFIASYDAGRAQRYYIFGSATSFADLVNYYRTVLKDKGNLVFQDPPTHMFEVGRFNNDTMAFPPGVTIKDFAWSGSQGYANPKPGAQPARFPSLIMIVPAPPGTPR
jgi:hypothetical protein